MKLARTFFLMCLIFEVAVANATEQEAQQPDSHKTSLVLVKTSDNPAMCHKSRLRPYEPSYMAIQKAQNDEWAIRVHYSLQYSVYPPRKEVPCAEAGPAAVDLVDHAYDIYLSYTGDFDFYAGTRPSGPVVNRTSNPAIHVRLQDNLTWLPLEWLDIGIEHRSDGQVVEPTDPAEKINAQAAYVNNDHRYFDSLSRGANYVSIEGHKKEKGLSAYAKLKLYWAQNTQITWGPLADTNTSISDYDRVKFVVRKEVGNGELSVDWTVGDKLFKTDSWNVDYLYSKNWPFTIFVRGHYGPLQTLSNYTQNQSSLGVGLKFTP